MKKIILALIFIFSLLILFIIVGQTFYQWNSSPAIVITTPFLEKETEVVFCNLDLSDQPTRDRVIFNEVAWMGTEDSSLAEWIELKNLTNQEINLSGWQILDKGNQIKVILGLEQPALISANSFFLLERTGDDSVHNIVADLIYTGGLSNTNESLYLFNSDCQLQDLVLADPNWPAGDNKLKKTMERKQSLDWQTSLGPGGTARAINSLTLLSSSPPLLGLATESILEAEPASPAENLLLNQFFEDWDSGLPVNWVWHETLTRLGQDNADPLIGQRNLWLRPIRSHNVLRQAITGIPNSKYYAEIWVKGTDGVMARVGIRVDGNNRYGEYLALENNEWTKITWSRDSLNGEDDGILISVKESVGHHRSPIYLGAAWFSTTPPPQNWPRN